MIRTLDRSCLLPLTDCMAMDWLVTSGASFYSAVCDDYSITYSVALQWVTELIHVKDQRPEFPMLCVAVRGLRSVSSSCLYLNFSLNLELVFQLAWQTPRTCLLWDKELELERNVQPCTRFYVHKDLYLGLHACRAGTSGNPGFSQVAYISGWFPSQVIWLLTSVATVQAWTVWYHCLSSDNIFYCCHKTK